MLIVLNQSPIFATSIEPHFYNGILEPHIYNGILYSAGTTQ